MRSGVALALCLAAALLGASPARADEERAKRASVVPSAYVEIYYAFNFNAPANGITNCRAFDNRHATFTLQNAVIAVDGTADRFFARVARSDLVVEKRATKAGVTSGALLFPSRWLTSQAIALDARPVSQVSVRLEYRHDASRDPLFFPGAGQGAGTSPDPYLANARSQDTMTLGMTAWF